jgi:hypothetical protein
MKGTVTEMPKAALFERALSAELSHSKAHDVVEAARARYGGRYAGREQEDSGAVRRHLEENLLPGVALYRALLADPDTGEEAMPLFEVAVEAWVASQRRSLETLARLPVYYWLMWAVIKPMMRRNFPEAGWETEWVQANGQALAFNMKSCFYMDVLGAYGVPELAIQYCRMDDLIYEDLSPHVHWVRQGTLGRGDRHCDFRFERVKG